jgi:type I restriction enzyme, S subunit
VNSLFNDETEITQAKYEKEFAINGVMTPRLRYKGFSNTWEQCELSELANFGKGSGYSKGDLIDSGSPIILYGRLYTKYETTISDVDTFVVQKSGSVITKGGEVIVPASGETAEDIAIASVVEKPGILLGGDLNVIYPNEKIDPTFLAISITYGKPHIDMATRAQGKSVVHLHNSDLRKVMLDFPKREEQLKISQYIKSIDNLITLHQRKYDKLVNTKKALLDKMFAKAGEVTPKLRFRGFTDAWEQCELGELAPITMGQSPNGVNYTSNPENYILVQGNADMENGKVRPRVWTTQITKLAKPNDLIFSVRAPVGSVGKTDYEAVIGRGVASIRGNEFIYQQLLKLEMNGYWKTISTGSTFDSINSAELKTTLINAPKHNEQEKISSFLNSVDKLITLNKYKLEKLKNIKKALLEKMFVQ